MNQPKSDEQKKELINRSWMTKSEQRRLVTKKAIYGLTPTEISVLTALITVNNVGKELKTANAELPFTVRHAKIKHRTGHAEAVVGRSIHHIAEVGLLTILPFTGKENWYKLHLSPMYDWKVNTKKTKKQMASATNAEGAREAKRLKQQVEDDAAAEVRRAYQRKFIQKIVLAAQERHTRALQQVIQEIQESGERRYQKLAQAKHSSTVDRERAPEGALVLDPIQPAIQAEPQTVQSVIEPVLVVPIETPAEKKPVISEKVRAQIAELRAMPTKRIPAIGESPLPPRPMPTVRLYNGPREDED